MGNDAHQQDAAESQINEAWTSGPDSQETHADLQRLWNGRSKFVEAIHVNCPK